MDTVKDPVAKLTFEKQDLQDQLKGVEGFGVEAEKIRVDLASKIYVIEKSITAEREKQAQVAANASKSALEKEAQYAFEKLSTEGKLKVVQENLNKLEAKRKSGGLNDDERGKRIDLFRQRDSLTASIEKVETKTATEAAKATAKATATDDAESPDKPKRKTRRMGSRGATEWFREQNQARREAMGANRLTYDSKTKSWASGKDVAQNPTKDETVDPIKETSTNIKRIADALCG